MKVGVVILARYSSSRLPGKALMKINGKETLRYIVERVERVVPKNNIVIATSTQESDDPIAKFASACGVCLFRGSLQNVAERFLQAGMEAGFDYIVRINGDNIFVDIPLLAEMIEFASHGQYDFLSNVHKRTYPKGMSVEIVSAPYYKSQMPVINSNPSYQEHVTNYLYELKNNRFYFFYNQNLPEAAGIQLALDTPEDFERSQAIIASFAHEHWKYNLAEILPKFKKIVESK
ncbi:MAG TPA: hypothetical protein VGD40_01815 [Chryseosolibacter sp.]